ncbi:ABC transporter ATP-binding protein [Paenibacillus ginsengarvi]|uniref:Carnitine transport ATP-binding protein OpuCA n=1 Tax=Paenibacillus ginsengarvi TaxID=400777 RepID=A0A3B0C4N2_9BACL|nr:ABC transporter ATP-binding protein [Paenibacillus ginsengarvi]RKN79154.1 ABC transporter ATP-binding protein [Paenibacillus ginsengarvi]
MAGSTPVVTKVADSGQQAAAPAKIEINGLSKVYKGRNGDVIALQNTDLTIRQNEFVCVVGPSGCGKTTLLNIIGGLEKATSGSVKVDGKEVTGPGKERGVVFQQYALFPWKTVLKNVEFGLKLRGLGKQERKEKAESYLEMVGLKDFADSYPKELSGGMKQRVAIARAYAVQPEVLLMDEPFGALDAQTRAQLQEDLLRTWQKEKKTCFFITHDVEEAVILAQRVIIMSARPGRIKEIIEVDIPYPRDQGTKLDPRFVEIKNEIWSKVYKEYLEVSK